MKKKILALLLSMVMIVTLLPLSSLAENEQADKATEAAITEFETLPDRRADIGTSWEELDLPRVLAVKLSDGTEKQIDIEYSSAPTYNGNITGIYEITALFADEYTLTDGITAPSFSITVQEAASAGKSSDKPLQSPVLKTATRSATDCLTMTSTAASSVSVGTQFDVQFTVKTEKTAVTDPKLVISIPGTMNIKSYDGTGSAIGGNLKGSPTHAEADSNAGTTTLTYDFKYQSDDASTMELTFPVRFAAYSGIADGGSFTIAGQLCDGETVIETKTIERTVSNSWQRSPTFNSNSTYISKNGYLASKDEIVYSSASPRLYAYTEVRYGRIEDVYPFTDINMVYALPACLTPGTGTDAASFRPMEDGVEVTSGNFKYTYYEAYNDNISGKTYKAIVYTCPGKSLRDVATISSSSSINIALPRIYFRSQLTDSDPMPSTTSSTYYYPKAADGSTATGRFTLKNGETTYTSGSSLYAYAGFSMDDIARKYTFTSSSGVSSLFAETESSYSVFAKNSSDYPIKDAEVTFSFTRDNVGDSPLEYYEARFPGGDFDLGTVTAYYRTNLNDTERSQVMTAAADTLSFAPGEYITALRVVFEKLPPGLSSSTALVTLKLRRLDGGAYTPDSYHRASATLAKPTFDGYTGDTTNVTAKDTYQRYKTIETMPVAMRLYSESYSDQVIGNNIYIESYIDDTNKLENPEFYFVMPNEYRFSGLYYAGSGYSFTTYKWDDTHTLYALVYSNGAKPNLSPYLRFTIGPTVNIKNSPQSLPAAFYYNSHSTRYPVVSDYSNEHISSADQALFLAATGNSHEDIWKYTGSSKTSVAFKNIGTFNTECSVGVNGGSEGGSVNMRLMDNGYYRLYFANHLSDSTNMTGFSTVITLPKDGGTSPVSETSTRTNSLSLDMTGAVSGGGIFSGADLTYSTDGGQTYSSSVSSWAMVTHVKATVDSVEIAGGATGYVNLPLRPAYDGDTEVGDIAYIGAQMSYTRDDTNSVDRYMEPVTVFAANSALSGIVYYDDDADGIKDSNETTNPYGTVYLDEKINNGWQMIDYSTSVTSFNLDLLLAGEYRLRYKLPDNSTNKFDTAHSQFKDTTVDTDGISGNEVATEAITISRDTPVSQLSIYSLGLQRERAINISTSKVNLAYGQNTSANINLSSAPALQTGENYSCILEDDENFTVQLSGNTARVSYTGPAISKPVSTTLTISSPNTSAFGGKDNPVTREVAVNVLPYGCEYDEYDPSFVLSTSSGSTMDVGAESDLVVPYNDSKRLYYKLDLGLKQPEGAYCTKHSARPQAKIEIIEGSDIAAFYYSSYASATASTYTDNVTLGGGYYYYINFTGSGKVKVRATLTNPHNEICPTTLIEKTINVVKQNKIDFDITPADDLSYDGSSKEASVTATNYNTGEAFTDTDAYTVTYKKNGHNLDAPREPGIYTAEIAMTDTSNNAPYVMGAVSGTKTFTITKADASPHITLADKEITYGDSYTPSPSVDLTDEKNVSWTYNYKSTGSTGAYDSSAAPADAGTYTVTATYSSDRYSGSKASKLTILPRPVTASFKPQSKVYDGTDTITIAAEDINLNNKLDSDNVYFSAATGTFTGGKDVTEAGAADNLLVPLALAGSDKDNYTVTSPAVITGTVTSRPVGINLGTITKAYDASTTVKFAAGYPRLEAADKDSGIIAADSENVALTAPPAAYESAGTPERDNTGIKISFDGNFALTAGSSGDSSGNYMLAQPENITGSIMAGFTAQSDTHYKLTNGGSSSSDWLDGSKDFLIEALDNCSISQSLSGPWTSAIAKTSESQSAGSDVVFYVKSPDGEISKAQSVTYFKDNTAPACQIVLAQNSWKTFANALTFKKFFKDTQDVKILPPEGKTFDELSGIHSVSYWIDESGNSYDSYSSLEAAASWQSMASDGGKAFTAEPNSKFAVYARLEDKAGNAFYCSSDGLVFYTDSAAAANISYTRTSRQDITADIAMNGNTVDKVMYEGRQVSSDSYTLGTNQIKFHGSYLETFAQRETPYEFILSYKPQNEAYVDEAGNAAPATTTIQLNVTRENQNTLSISDVGTKTYGDSQFTLSTTGGSGTGDVTFTSSDPATLSITGSTATIHKAGQVTIHALKAADGDYSDSNRAEYALQIHRLGISQPVVSNRTLIYNGQTQVLLADGTGYTVADGTKKSAGDYRATASLNENYKWADVDEPLAPLEISWKIKPLSITVTAHDKEKFFGDAEPDLTWSAAPAMFPGDVLTGSLKYEGNGVGSYDIVEETPLRNKNYAVTFVKGQMRIKNTPAMDDVIALINNLPSEVQDYEDADTVANVTNFFEELTEAQRNQLPQAVRQRLDASQEEAGEVNRLSQGGSAAGQLPWNVRVVIEDIPKADAARNDFGKFDKEVSSHKRILGLYDIYLVNTQTGERYEIKEGDIVTITLQQDLAGVKNVLIAHQKADGTIEYLPCQVNGNSLTFTATGFSLYGVVTNVEKAADGVPVTGDSSMIWICLLLAALSGAGLTASLIRGRQKN